MTRISLTRALMLAGVLLGLAVAPVVQAQTILSYMTKMPTSLADWCATLQLPKFDPALGTLTDVTLIYSANIAQSVFGENKSGSNARYDFTTTAWLSLGEKNGPMLLPSAHAVLHQSGILKPFDGKADYAGLSGVRVNQATPIFGQFDDRNLSAYLGHGSVYFNASADICSALDLSGCAGITGASAFADGSLTIQYTYAALTPVPEPATSAAWLGVLALGLVLRRRVTTA
jgi:hypothetical protein